ncbi:L-arabinonate dehydratase [soil metagenome]
MATTPTETPVALRSRRWYGGGPFSFEHLGRTMQSGFSLQDFDGKPVVGIITTWSEANPCHAHLRDVADAVKRGIWEAGGFALEIPVMSLGETLMKPTTMLHRNLAAMETEEVLRAHPLDAAVLLGGCDKTTPALLMGAISADIPSVYVPAGFMMHGSWRGERLGAAVTAWKYSTKLVAGEITMADWYEIEDGYACSPGTCNVMGTASTMTAVAEVLGLTMPGASSVPAGNAHQKRLASAAGRCAVTIATEGRCPSDLLTEASFRNAIVAELALGGSTNAAIHIPAIAGRAEIDLPLARFDEIARTVPVLADVEPSGSFLMEDFYEAGGLRALLHQLRDRLDLSCPTVNGRTLGENLEGAAVFRPEVIRPVDDPVEPLALAVLRGNLAPDGAVLKVSAATPALLRHRGPAVVFADRADLDRRLNDPDLEVDADSVLVLQHAGPKGGPGMPEWGMIPLPHKLARAGVRDMVRISDARMSGTSHGTTVLHVAPESFVGGTLALVRDGDLIDLDVPARRIELLVDEDELAARRAAWVAPTPHYQRGWGALFSDNIMQADRGCDFEVLRGRGGAPEPAIYY